MSESLLDVTYISDAQKDQLVDRLKKIEYKYNIKIIHAVVTGSRLFGLNTENSDFDIKFIYVDPLAWYFDPNKKRYSISFVEDDCDFTGFNMEKSIATVIKSSGVFLEWIRSDIILYTEGDFLKEIEKYIKDFYSPIKVFNYYRHISRKVFINIKLIMDSIHADGENVDFALRRKALKYFFLYVRSSLSLHKCRQYGQIPIKFNILVNDSILDEKLKSRIITIMDNYKENLFYTVTDVNDFNILVDSMCNFNHTHTYNYPEKSYVSPTSIIDFHKSIVLKNR